MAARYDFYWRLEPDPQRRSLAAGFAAAILDPVWFLARQWQMGENQGENASSPVLVNFTAAHTMLKPALDDPRCDPTIRPAESIVEAEPDDWWTMGRRIRLGAILAARAGLDLAAAPQDFLLADPPPPYEQFAGRFDGLALWRNRVSLDPAGDRFAGLGIPDPRPFFWDSAELVYSADFPVAGQNGRVARLPRHRGGVVDWFSADSDGADSFQPAGEEVDSQVYPTQLHYPGSPCNRWWEIEDAAVDIGGYPPDSSHFPTTLLIELIASHSNDWFLFPVDGRGGHVLTLKGGTVKVTDSFGDIYDLSPPTDNWHLFRTTGLDDNSLVLWLRAASPIKGVKLEDVLVGLDEYSNLLWAVERRVNGLEVIATPMPAASSRAGDPGDQKRFMYIPGQDAVPYWHPYQVEDSPDREGFTRRRFVQRRLANLSLPLPELLPAPLAQVLRVFTGEIEGIHEIAPATIPSIGLTLERRYSLARDISGNPLLWLERRRSPFLTPPGRNLRFDVFAEDTA
jgi:hypothetical protein